MGLLRWLLRRLADRGGRARVVRRVAMHCPHGGGPVEIDLLMGETGMPAAVLRCSRRRQAPPTCDQACRHCAEAVVGPARSLLILPPGQGPPEQID